MFGGRLLFCMFLCDSATLLSNQAAPSQVSLESGFGVSILGYCRNADFKDSLIVNSVETKTQ